MKHLLSPDSESYTVELLPESMATLRRLLEKQGLQDTTEGIEVALSGLLKGCLEQLAKKLGAPS